MRTARLALAAVAFGLAGACTAATIAPSDDVARVSGSPSWAKDAPGQTFGFAPVTVTQSGVTYAPGEPATAAAGQDAQSLAELPAWASIPKGKPQSGGVFATLGLGTFQSLPEPAVWALLLTGFAIIGGALRGLILVNRRLERLRAEEEPADEE